MLNFLIINIAYNLYSFHNVTFVRYSDIIVANKSNKSLN